MSRMHIAILAVIQGLTELLPVSSSAHVIVAERLMGLDPSSPEMTFLLVMLHTGTMFAVIFYFWPRWRNRLARTGQERFLFFKTLILATITTGIVGLTLKKFIEKICLRGAPKQEIEALSSNLPLIALALASVGLLIILAGRKASEGGDNSISARDCAWIGAVQGLCLPFRGFSRSGATISTALFCGISRALAEDFSFALAVVLTPPVIAKEAHRLLKASQETHQVWHNGFASGALGMVFSFATGLLALHWLSGWLEQGRWKYFGYYCLIAAAAVFCVSKSGF